MILHILCKVHPVTGQAHRQQAAVHLHIKAVQKMAAAIRELQVHQVDRRLLADKIQALTIRVHQEMHGQIILAVIIQAIRIRTTEVIIIQAVRIQVIQITAHQVDRQAAQ